jgi:hypothetical protein
MPSHRSMIVAEPPRSVSVSSRTRASVPLPSNSTASAPGRSRSTFASRCASAASNAMTSRSPIGCAT